jgi:outer membrane protein assembly factor BamB
MDWHPNGPVLLAGSADGTIWMWNVVKKVCMSVFSGHSDAVTCGGFTPDGKHIVSGSADGSVLVWDPKTAAVLFRFNSGGLFHEGSIGALAIHPDNQLVLTGSDDGTARLIQIATGKILAKLEQHLDSVEAVAFCPT